MVKFNMALMWLLAVVSWGLALYLFYEGQVAAGFGALIASGFASFLHGVGEGIGAKTLKSSEKEAYRKGYAVALGGEFREPPHRAGP